MSRFSQLLKTICISSFLCFNFLPIYSVQAQTVIEPQAAYTKTVTYDSSCYLNKAYTLSSTFQITADDTTGIINSISFINWSLSPSYGGFSSVSCRLISLNKVNNYKYTATLQVDVVDTLLGILVNSDTVIVTINSPGPRSIIE